jgi:hypothetical protein
MGQVRSSTRLWNLRLRQERLEKRKEYAPELSEEAAGNKNSKRSTEPEEFEAFAPPDYYPQ